MEGGRRGTDKRIDDSLSRPRVALAIFDHGRFSKGFATAFARFFASFFAIAGAVNGAWHASL
jgi:hypothetical protein